MYNAFGGRSLIDLKHVFKLMEDTWNICCVSMKKGKKESNHDIKNIYSNTIHNHFFVSALCNTLCISRRVSCRILSSAIFFNSAATNSPNTSFSSLLALSLHENDSRVSSSSLNSFVGGESPSSFTITLDEDSNGSSSAPFSHKSCISVIISDSKIS
jgi:hypothetical protein